MLFFLFFKKILKKSIMVSTKILSSFLMMRNVYWAPNQQIRININYYIFINYNIYMYVLTILVENLIAVTITFELKYHKMRGLTPLTPCCDSCDPMLTWKWNLSCVKWDWDYVGCNVTTMSFEQKCEKQQRFFNSSYLQDHSLTLSPSLFFHVR